MQQRTSSPGKSRHPGLAVLAAIAALALAGCGSRNTYVPPPPPKVVVAQPVQEPVTLYAFLTDKNLHPETGGDIGWNFTKFLVGPDGKVIARFDSKVEPESPEVTSAVEKSLAELNK